ncbi:hypothetical protein E4U42_004142 [Claviceps africana]|uniref:Zn(2)-C6 fungal-type domain-containing protein n=1 Tax=Claviceps africana TaxID=83212 RepID=A0A8K0NIB2_9HYPO|nr:hypothetical protein E4U42_004142 [Claviceps africana]
MHIVEVVALPSQPVAVPSPQAAATSSNLEEELLLDSANEQLAKRGRRSNTKVKTGCSNCKQRRVKCDERRPSCTQCLRNKKLCIGYPPPARGTTSTADIPIAPKPSQAVGLNSAGPVLAPAGIIEPTVLPPRRTKRRRRKDRISQQAITITTTSTLYQPSTLLGLQQSECLYFQLFRVQTASELSGYFNSSFWGQRILQECHAESAIRHAVVALGALYKTLEENFHMSAMPLQRPGMHVASPTTHWQVAIKQYSEACKAMMLIHGQSLRSYRIRLMATILLTCFDSFIGHHKLAIVQIQSGLGLLEQLQSQYPDHRSPRPEGYIEDEVLNIFTRLAIQAKSYDMAFHFPQPYVIRLGPQQTRSLRSSPGGFYSSATSSSELTAPALSSRDTLIPGRFSNLLEARQASDRLCETLVRFIERLQIAKNNTSNVLPASWLQYGMNLNAQLDAWAEAFGPIFQSRLDPRVDDVEKAGIAALKMFQINSGILFLTMFCDTEVQFDAFFPQFKTVVDLGWEVVEAEERKAAALEKASVQNSRRRRNPAAVPTNTNTMDGSRAGQVRRSRIKPSFAADLGIVPPLYVVATKCREPRLRRRAIQLLRSSARREGMWDSELAARIGQWVMDIEESDVGPLFWSSSVDMPSATCSLAKLIPEEKRVMVKTADFDLQRRVADLRVGTRAVPDDQADDRLQETHIVW